MGRATELPFENYLEGRESHTTLLGELCSGLFLAIVGVGYGVETFPLGGGYLPYAERYGGGGLLTKEQVDKLLNFHTLHSLTLHKGVLCEVACDAFEEERNGTC